MTGDLERRLIAHIDEHGPLRFDRYMDLALYDPNAGFYSVGGGAGRRRGDFITSPEVGPLFGAVVARALDSWWQELGEPREFAVAEFAAGRGSLARAVFAAEPACAESLAYRLVETSPALRAEHQDLCDRGAISEATLSGPGQLPRVDVIVANELLDNLPTRVLERTPTGWSEVAVSVGAGVALIDVLVEVDEPLPPQAVAALPVGTRIPWAEQAAEWVEHARRRATHRTIVFDYGAPTAELATRGHDGWLRAYRGHSRVDDVLDAPGTADITVDVPFDQLTQPHAQATQADWLGTHGIDEMTDAARRTWEAERAAGGMAALRARSAVIEAEALTDPAGLGAFEVLEWLGEH